MNTLRQINYWQFSKDDEEGNDPPPIDPPKKPDGKGTEV